MNVNEIMTAKVITVNPEMDLHKLAALFVEKDISGAPVVDASGKLLGIVLEEDLISRDKNVHLPTFLVILSGLFAVGEKRFEQEMEKIAAINVSGIMQKSPKVIEPSTPVEDVATMMIDQNIHYFPVADKGALVGVVTKKDIVRAIAQGKLQ